MQKDQLGVKDKATITKEEVGNLDEVLNSKKKYEIVSPNGLFKNGKQYKQGQTIMLDPKTANSFIANKDIKEL